MASYTQDLINILYTGIYHDFDDIYHFIKFMKTNMSYEFSEGVTFGVEDTAFVYYINGESFFIADVDEEKIVFSPGGAFQSITQEPELVKEAMLSFLIFFKNYDTIHNVEELEKDFRDSKEKKKKRVSKLVSKKTKEKTPVKFIEEDHSEEEPEKKQPANKDADEDSSSESDDEWL